MNQSRLDAALLTGYRTGQGEAASGSIYRDIRTAWPHYEANYRELLAGMPKDARVVELGPGHGSLLAWLREFGYRRLEGVDLSPGDVEFANGHLGEGVVVQDDVRGYLEMRPASYDLVLMKAVLEHLPREELLPTLRAIAVSLTERGMLIVEVPNMDWLLASHERYLDLTHRVGFTPESLTSVLMLVFSDVTVRGSILANPTRSQRWFRRPLLAVLRRAFYVLGEGGNDTLFHHRSLLATASQYPSTAVLGASNATVNPRT